MQQLGLHNAAAVRHFVLQRLFFSNAQMTVPQMVDCAAPAMVRPCLDCAPQAIVFHCWLLAETAAVCD